MADRPAFQATQYAFAAHIRDPDTVPAPEGIEDRRMAIYRELFYNNTENLLAGTFPVLRRILPDAQWHALIRDYFAHHQCHTPLFLEVPREFLRFLEDERGEQKGDPAYLQELAHYEWVELALQILEVEPAWSDASAHTLDFLDGCPQISPTAWWLSYRFPVHRIGPDFLPATAPPEPTFLLVSRDRSDTVAFTEINAVTTRLLELLNESDDITGRQALQRIAREMDHPQPQTVIDGGQHILIDLYRQDVITDVRPLPDKTP